jgi:predicted transcriptional regulator of viral defense system
MWVSILSYNMRNKIALQKIKTLLKHPSFTSKEALVYGVSASTLAYYVKVGELTRIGHGLYKKSDRTIVDDFRWEDLVEATMRVKNGIVCLVSALALYDITEEIPRQHWIAIHHNTRHRDMDTIRIVRMRNIELGKTSLKIDKVKIQIFDIERTIVDTFRYLSIETGIKALRMALQKKGKKKIDIQKIRKYAQTLKVKIEPFILSETTI